MYFPLFVLSYGDDEDIDVDDDDVNGVEDIDYDDVYGLPAYSQQSYSHLEGICLYDEGWENDTVTYTKMYKSVIYE